MSEKQPELVRTEDLPEHFRAHNIAYKSLGSVGLGFGHGKDQYRLYDYPAPQDDETMGLFCEWHTEDYFNVDTGPHVAIGLRGPVKEDPHRGRGLAIGVLAGEICLPANPGQLVPLFAGCPAAPGGPSFFIEDFSRNDGHTPVPDWQLSRGRHLPELQGHGVYRIDIHISKTHAWAGVWQIQERGLAGGSVRREYTFMNQVYCCQEGPGYSGTPGSPCPELAIDRGRGNAFIGSGFSDPETRSRVDNIYIAHWKS